MYGVPVIATCETGESRTVVSPPALFTLYTSSSTYTTTERLRTTQSGEYPAFFDPPKTSRCHPYMHLKWGHSRRACICISERGQSRRSQDDFCGVYVRDDCIRIHLLTHL